MSASSGAARFVLEGGAGKLFDEAAQSPVGSKLAEQALKVLEREGWGVRANAPADLAKWGIGAADRQWQLPVIAMEDESRAILGRNSTAHNVGRIVINPDDFTVRAEVPMAMDPRAARNLQAMGGMFRNVLQYNDIREVFKAPDLLRLDSDPEIRAAAKGIRAYIAGDPTGWTAGSQLMHGLYGPRDGNWLARLAAKEAVPDSIKHFE